MCVWSFIQKAPGGTLGTYKHIDHTNGMPCGGDPVSRSHPIRMELWDGVQNPPLLAEAPRKSSWTEWLREETDCSGQRVGLGQANSCGSGWDFLKCDFILQDSLACGWPIFNLNQLKEKGLLGEGRTVMELVYSLTDSGVFRSLSLHPSLPLLHLPLSAWCSLFLQTDFSTHGRHTAGTFRCTSVTLDKLRESHRERDDLSFESIHRNPQEGQWLAPLESHIQLLDQPLWPRGLARPRWQCPSPWLGQGGCPVIRSPTRITYLE